MKKIIAMILSLAMLLCAASAMAEEPKGKVTIGTLSINGAFTLQCGLPEGYKPTPVSVTTDQVVAVIKSEDPNAPTMGLSVAYDEMYSDVERLNDLTPEERAQLEQTFIDEDPNVEITYGETGYGTLLLIARHESDGLDYVAFFSIYKGYTVHFVLTPSKEAESRDLTEEQMRLSIDFLTDLDFIPADAPVFSKRIVAGQKFVTNLSGYDPEANTVIAEVIHGIPLPETTVEALEVGDTLRAGRFELEITKLDITEEGDIVINDGDAELRKYGDEYHIILDDDREYTEPYGTLTLEIPDTLSIEDGIDRKTGEILDEPVQYTVEEFKSMLSDENLSPDFASDNVWVAYDDDGEMISVERFYTPWQ